VRITTLTLSAALLLAVSAAAGSTEGTTALRAEPHVRAVRMITTPDQPTTVVIEGDAPLPTPTVGVVGGPPRIYLDFVGVLPQAANVIAQGDPWIRRVRIAQHSQDPLVTRVVIDLLRPTAHNINAPSPDRVVISVGGEGPRPAVTPTPVRSPGRGSGPAPVPPLPPAPAPSAADKSPTRPPSPKEPASRSDVQPPPPASSSYVKTVTALVARFEQQRPLLMSIDTRGEQAAVSLQVAANEINSIVRSLGEIRPSRALAPTHDRLLQACTLAVQAIQARMEAVAAGNPTLEWNAASAAAGALLLLDRVRNDLGLTKERHPDA